MATDADDEIYSDSPSNETVKNIQLIKAMYEIPKRTETSGEKNPIRSTRNCTNVSFLNPTAKHPATPKLNGNSGASPTVPQKTTKVEVSPSSQPPKNNQKTSLGSRPSVMPKSQGTSSSNTNGVVNSIPHKGTNGGEYGIPSVRTSNFFHQAERNRMEPAKIPSNSTGISKTSSNGNSVCPPADKIECGTNCQTNGNVPPLPARNETTVELVVSGHKTYRKLPFSSLKTIAPRKKALPPNLPRNFYGKLMELKKTERNSIEAKTSVDTDELLPYEDIYEDASTFAN